MTQTSKLKRKCQALTADLGCFRMVRASATRCFWPPLSMRPRSPTTVSYPSGIASICVQAPYAVGLKHVTQHGQG